MVVPDVRRKIVKKRTKRFTRMHADRYLRVHNSWRKPKGIDCCVRRKFRGCVRMPNCGYGSNRKTRFRCPDGFYKFTVQNESDLNMLVMQNRRYCVEIARTVGSTKRRGILSRADALDIKVINRSARVTAEENE
eukprot:TRINITY_DN180131_c0_g1_i1.p2 TRINITY_DN180131_c0_g1~~TRINITY_DN180131_c0_g1_i1.p2  ORF type:complete len:134 (+),score=5.02 TRINITY_DN180131_c0_g1_i1:45-446(+)